ncbi:hypothetical protein CDL15_Pgr000092 [Punica granatum]|uniref:BHLH domain-containing protein n=1 Tax=Punica granatum TaxID=22663 RepID=A0A218Y2S1_PUNGR|nr:hypothetical protein CDL15_Pgr000092 [Punica granatum]
MPKTCRSNSEHSDFHLQIPNYSFLSQVTMYIQDLILTDYVHPHDHTVFNFSLSSHGQEMLGGHEPQLRPNYSLPKPFVSGQTTNDSNKAPEDADVDEENKKKKTRHREIERHRRKEMNTLYASLRSLLPAQILKGKRAVSDQLNVALGYINQIQRNIKKLETERARLKKKGLDKMWYFL